MVRLKLHTGGPQNPNLLAKRIVRLPPVPPNTVFVITLEMITPSPGFVMEPSDPPLNERNPVIRIIAPIPSSCACVRKSNNYTYSKRDEFESLGQGCTSAESKVAMAIRFFMAAPNIFRSIVWNSLHVNVVKPRILRWLLDFWKICASLI